MRMHERFAGEYEYVVQTTKFARLSDKYDYAAKVERLMRRVPGAQLVEISVLRFGEAWGATEDGALGKIVERVEAWIRQQKAN
jgi:hypothetical protein